MASRLQLLCAFVLWLVGCDSDYSSAEAPITTTGGTSGGEAEKSSGGASTALASTGGTSTMVGTSIGGAMPTGGATAIGSGGASGGESMQDPTGGTTTGGSLAAGGQMPATAGSAGSVSTGGNTGSTTTTGGQFAVAGQPGSGGALSVVRVSFVAAAGSPSDTTIATTVALENVSSKPLELGTIVVRYWLTTESTTAALVGACTASVCGNAVVATGLVSPARAGADHFVEYRLGTSNLAVGAKVSLTFDTHRSDWGTFNELDDYSYPSSTTKAGDELERVTVQQAGGLVWGVEP